MTLIIKYLLFKVEHSVKNNQKYLTVKLDENKQKVYGLDRVNLQEHIHIVEGPIDSMFVKNCFAKLPQT